MFGFGTGDTPVGNMAPSRDSREFLVPTLLQCAEQAVERRWRRTTHTPAKPARTNVDAAGSGTAATKGASYAKSPAPALYAYSKPGSREKLAVRVAGLPSDVKKQPVT